MFLGFMLIDGVGLDNPKLLNFHLSFPSSFYGLLFGISIVSDVDFCIKAGNFPIGSP